MDADVKKKFAEIDSAIWEIHASIRGINSRLPGADFYHDIEKMKKAIEELEIEVNKLKDSCV